MTRPTQDEAIRQAINDLTWCTDPSHDIDRIVSLSSNRWPRTRWPAGTTTDQMAQDMRDDADNYGDVTGRSDPTGEAAINGRGATYARSRINPGTPAGEPSEGINDPTTPAIDSAIALIYWSCSDLTTLCLDNERIIPADDRTDRINAALTALHRLAPLITQARDTMDRRDRDLCDELVYQGIGETADWLRQKGEALCHGSKRAGQPVPQPGDQPKGCVSCARDRDGSGRPYFEPVDDRNHAKREMCRRCGDYTSGQGTMPPVGAVEYVHRTGKNWTQKILWDAERNDQAS